MKNASITVFMTIVFLLFFSLLGVTYENVRILSAESYCKTAGESGAMTVFGKYNKELFDEYGLYGYGGYDGKGSESLCQEFSKIFDENIKMQPDSSLKKYADLYRIKDVDININSSKNITDKEYFYNQIEGFLKVSAVKSISDELSDISWQQNDTAKEKLEMAKDYEDGKYDEANEENNNDVIETDEIDEAGGNPLESFADMIRDGALSMVCDVDKLSDEKIEIIEEIDESQSEENEDISATEYLDDFLERNSTVEIPDIAKESKEKTELLLYANNVFSNYGNDVGKSQKYGLEFMAAGKEEEKDNFSYIVNRIMAIRMLINFTYVVSNPSIQEKSLATATALAGFTGLPPVVTAVQYAIMLILSYEEACVDVTALLDGKKVPLIKTTSNFKMKYEEICLGGKELFKKKAKTFQDNEKGIGSMSYRQYLFGFLIITSEEELRKRAINLIQDDLRKRFNQSFDINSCICKTTFEINYKVPFIFENLPFISMKNMEKKNGLRTLEVVYGYKR